MITSVLVLIGLMAGDVVQEIQYPREYWDLKGYEDYARGLYDVRFTPDGRHVIAPAERNLFSVAHDELSHGLSEVQMMPAIRNGTEIAMGADGTWFIVGTHSGNFFRLNPTTGRVEEALDVDLYGRDLNLIRDDEELLTLFGAAIYVYDVDAATATFTETAVYSQDDLGVDGLNGAQDLVVSPNEQNVYIGGTHEGGGIATYYRDTVTGDLYFLEFIRANDPINMLISEDGAYMYSASWAHDSIEVYELTGPNGEPNLIQTLQYGVAGVDGINGILEMAISPDGTTLAACSKIQRSLAVFQRDPATGLLTFEEAIFRPGDWSGFEVEGIDFSPNGETLVAIAYNRVYAFEVNAGRLTYNNYYSGSYNGLSGIRYATDVTASRDGGFVYLSDPVNSQLTTYPNEAFNGGLGLYPSTLDAAALPGLTNADYMSISGDGGFAYHLSRSDSTLMVTRRDSGDGSLSFVQQLSGISGMDGPTEVVESPDGLNVYVPAERSDSLLVFGRDPATGSLTHIQTLTDGGGVTGLNGVVGVAITPDGSHAYSVGRDAEALTMFSRNPALSFDLRAPLLRSV